MQSHITATFDLLALRFRFNACDPIYFPPGTAANLFRGQFGRILKAQTSGAYARLFAPSAAAGPSGLHDPPRPFVLRVRNLEGARILPGEHFEVGINLFETSSAEFFEAALAQLAREGLGPVRAKAILDSVEGREPLQLSLTPAEPVSDRVRVTFLTPTELKGVDRPEFGVLFSRIRDRISTLRALYGPGPLEIDFKSLGEQASQVTMTRCEIDQVRAERRSASTGQRHSLGGFIGVAEYQGDLSTFLPYLEIARWAGVGRQTVWGKGEISVETY